MTENQHFDDMYSNQDYDSQSALRGESNPMFPDTSSHAQYQEPNHLQEAKHIEDIRLGILQKRIQMGLGHINLQTLWRLSGPQKLSPEEEQKRRQRRERNRQAAARCRERRRQRAYVLVQETEDLENSNDDLKKEIEALEQQRLQLTKVLNEHRPTCEMQIGMMGAETTAQSQSSIPCSMETELRSSCIVETASLWPPSSM
ncbi:fos-related antigen 1-like [Anneissia japonica]|uniref:fos-related antigen 1-like n=1 Tax=Anneissia japonica TaxID=1529436 RepID=UPI0014255E41|nr:fos-related antigen 1-like [Anneissia japonica]